MTYKNVSNISQRLSSETRLKIIKILMDRDLTVKEVRDIYERKHERDIRRESIYRELEKLRDSGLVKKEYYEEQKNFRYSLSYKIIKIDLDEMEVTFDK